MCFSVVCLCTDESCFMGHFLPPPNPKNVENLHFITIFLITDVVFLINISFLLFKNKSSWEQ